MTTEATESQQPSPPMGVSSSEGLGPGDWLALEFGFERRIFYVLAADARGAWLGHPRWLVRSAICVPLSRLKDAQRLGRGRARWWWRFFPLRQFVPPFSKPHGLYWA